MQTLEKYYEHNKDKDLFPILFSSLVEKGFEKKLEAIASVDINFNLLNFDEDLFQDKYINVYGTSILLKLQNRININLLDAGLNDPRLREKIIFFANEKIFDKITRNHIYNEDFTILLINEAKEIFNSFELSCFIKMMAYIDNNEINELKNILKNKEYLFNFRFLLTRIHDFTFRFISDNKDSFYSENFSIYIKTLIKYKVNLKDNQIFPVFKKYKYLFNDENIINIPEIKLFLEDKNRDKYGIKDINDLKNFSEIRKKYYKNDDIFESLFRMSKIELLETIKNFIIKNKTLKFISDEEIKLLSDLNYLIENPSFFFDIKNKYNASCKKEIVSSLYIPSKKEVIDLSTRDFKTIAHKIRFISDKNIGKNLAKDLSIWDSNHIEGAYISGTLIDQYSLGMIDSTENIMCFSNLSQNDILDMGLKDIFASIYLYYNNLENHLSDFFTIDDFNHSTESFYNEVVLRRFNPNALKPDFILGFDHINSFMKEASEYFNIPIGLIDSNKSSNRMHEHNMSLLERKKFYEFAIFVYKFYASYRYKFDIIKKYFKNSNDILSKIDLNNKELLEFMIDIFERINHDIRKNGLLDCEIDTSILIKK